MYRSRQLLSYWCITGLCFNQHCLEWGMFGCKLDNTIGIFIYTEYVGRLIFTQCDSCRATKLQQKWKSYHSICPTAGEINMICLLITYMSSCLLASHWRATPTYNWPILENHISCWPTTRLLYKLLIIDLYSFHSSRFILMDYHQLSSR